MNRDAITKSIQKTMLGFCTFDGICREEDKQCLLCYNDKGHVDVEASWANVMANVPHDILREKVYFYCNFPHVMDLWAQTVWSLHDDLTEDEFVKRYPMGFAQEYFEALANIIKMIS